MLDLSLKNQKKLYSGSCIQKNFKYDNYTYAVNPPLQPYAAGIKVEVDGCITGRSC